MLMKKISWFLLFCTSCHLGPPYIPPSSVVPVVWKNGTGEMASLPCTVQRWWEIFDDPCLNQLEERAVCCNPEVALAIQRIAEARALAGVERSALAPQVTFNPLYGNQSTLFQFYGPGAVFSLLSLAKRVFRIHVLQYFLPVNLNYELDLWGKLRGRWESAWHTAEAECWDKQVVLLSLTSDLAMSYYTLRYLDAQILLYQMSVRDLEESLKLTRSRFNEGLVDYLNVAASSRQLTQIQADMEELIRERALQEDLIALLIGQPASCLTLPRMPLSHCPPPTIPEGLPANLLLRRPDLAEAERRMAAQHSLIGVAYASFFPSVSLTAAAGSFSPDIEDFLSWLSRYLSYTVSGNQDIAVGGRNRANLCAAYARFFQADAQYRELVLTAFREVEDALSNLRVQERQFFELSENAAWARETVYLSSQRYQNGLVNYLNLIDTQNSALESERNLIGLQGLRYLSTVQLIKALGGCW
jgi:outer membrane protein, multidrug efflux system